MYPQNAKEFREYKNRLDDHETAIDVSPCYRCNGFTGAETAYLDDDAKKELRQDVNRRTENGSMILPGSNKKASFRKTEKGEIILTSYYTDVAKIYRKRFYKLWEGYSVTTLNHIDEFLRINGYEGPGLSKYDWIMLETGKATKL